jgi:hypothetical protein
MKLEGDAGSETLMIEANASTYTTIDIGLTLFLTSFAALKGLLRLFPSWLTSGGNSERKATGGPRGSHEHHAVNNSRGVVGFEMMARRGHSGKAIRLDDKSDSESQEGIIT